LRVLEDRRRAPSFSRCLSGFWNGIRMVYSSDDGELALREALSMNKKNLMIFPALDFRVFDFRKVQRFPFD
jgi:hypothetical protein